MRERERERNRGRKRDTNEREGAINIKIKREREREREEQRVPIVPSNQRRRGETEGEILKHVAVAKVLCLLVSRRSSLSQLTTREYKCAATSKVDPDPILQVIFDAVTWST